MIFLKNIFCRTSTEEKRLRAAKRESTEGVSYGFNPQILISTVTVRKEDQVREGRDGILSITLHSKLISRVPRFLCRAMYVELWLLNWVGLPHLAKNRHAEDCFVHVWSLGGLEHINLQI